MFVFLCRDVTDATTQTEVTVSGGGQCVSILTYNNIIESWVRVMVRLGGVLAPPLCFHNERLVYCPYPPLSHSSLPSQQGRQYISNKI